MPLRSTLLLFVLLAATRFVSAQGPASAEDPDELRRGLTRVDVTVVDSGGNKLRGITVTGSHQGLLTEYAPDYRGVTNESGLATLWVQTGRYATERQLGTQIWIDAIEEAEGKTDRLRNTRQMLRLNYRQLLTSTTILMLPTAVSTDPVHGIAVRVKAINQDGEAVPGATISLQTSDMERTLERQTDERGQVLLEATVLGAQASVLVQGSKVDHRNGSTRFTLTSAMRRSGAVQDQEVRLERLAPEVSRARITVRVLSTTGQQLPDAEVRLAPQASVRGTAAAASTGPDGSALLPGGAPGLWTLEVRHGKFEPHREDIEMTDVDATYTVRLRERVAASEDSQVTVTVLAMDKKGSDGQLAPIANALLKWGTTTAGTDESGRVKIGFPGQMGVDLRIEAEGYEPATLSVPGGRYMLNPDLQRTVRLLPKDAAAQQDSRVEVTVLGPERSQPDGKVGPVAGARVSSSRASAQTDTQGKARIEYSGLVGVELRIESEGYDAATLRIAGGADQLPNQRREVRLVATRQVAGDDSQLELTVVADPGAEPGGRRQPLAGARVSRAGTTVVTDAQGKVSVPFVGQAGLVVRVDADGYLSGNLSVPPATVVAADAPIRHRREVSLKPDLPDEKTPVQLRFRITEVASTDRIAGAVVRVSAGGRVVGEGRSDGGGLAALRLDEAGTLAARRGLVYEVEAKGFLIGNGVIAAARLEPSREAVEQPVALDPVLEVTVRVLSGSGSNAPIVKAKVQLFNGAQATQSQPTETDEQGQAALLLTGPLVRTAMRDGLFVEVTADRYIKHRSTLNAQLLRVAAPLYLVQMAFETNDALAALAAEVARLEARKEQIQTDTAAFRARLQAADDALQAARSRQQIWDGRPGAAVGRPNLNDPGWLNQTPAFCNSVIQFIEGTERNFSADARFVVDQLQAGRDAADGCRSAPSPSALAAIEQAERAAADRLNGMRAPLQREQQRAAAMALEYETVARALQSPEMAQLRKAIADAAQAAKAATAAGEALKRARADLASARLAAGARLKQLGPSLLTPNDFALATALQPRIDALTVPDVDIDRDTGRLTQDLAALESDLQQATENLGRYDEPACKSMRERYRRMVDGMDADWFAADAATRVNNLPSRVAECRTAWEFANRQPTLVAVPDLAGLPPAAMANIVRNAGLTWGGPAAAGNAPSPALAGKLASQQPLAFAMVPPGTPVVALIWQDAVQPPPQPTPVMPAVIPPAPPATSLATVPNLGGLPSRLSMDVAIIASGLVPAYQNVAPAPYGMAGRFAGQSPNAGDKVAYGTVVRYGIYEMPTAAQPAPPPVAMLPVPMPATAGGVPNVIGDSLEQAQAKLEAVGLRVGGITLGDRPPNAAMAGRIYSQNPPAGSRVRAGSGVALRQYGPMGAAPPPPPIIANPPPVVAGPTGVVQGNCVTNEGPIGCTGTFAGNIYLACDGGVVQPANYASSVTVRANGSTELQIPSPGNQPYTVIGTMDRSGRVQVDRSEGSVRHRWVGQFSRTALPGGGGRLSGSGNYEANINHVDVRMKRCTGTFSLK